VVITNILIKFTLGIVNLLPYITFISGIAIVGPGESTKNIFFVVLYILMSISIPFLFIFYSFNVFRNKDVAREQRVLWVALLFFGNIVVYPFYWYLHICREPKKVKELEESAPDT